jgi:hypothetical protein
MEDDELLSVLSGIEDSPELEADRKNLEFLFSIEDAERAKSQVPVVPTIITPAGPPVPTPVGVQTQTQPIGGRVAAVGKAAIGDSLTYDDVAKKLGGKDLALVLTTDERVGMFPLKVIDADAVIGRYVAVKQLVLTPGDTICFQRSPDSIVVEEGAPELGASVMKRLTWVLSNKDTKGKPVSDYAEGTRVFTLIARVDPVREAEAGEPYVYEFEGNGYVGAGFVDGKTVARCFRVPREPGHTAGVSMYLYQRNDEGAAVSEGTIWPWWDAPLEAALNLFISDK